MDSTEKGLVVTNGVESSVVSEVKEKQDQEPILLDLNTSVDNQRVLSFEQVVDGVLKYQGRLYVPKDDGLQERILEEAHIAKYSIHSGATKMYHYLRVVYWLKV